MTAGSPPRAVFIQPRPPSLSLAPARRSELAASGRMSLDHKGKSARTHMTGKGYRLPGLSSCTLYHILMTPGRNTEPVRRGSPLEGDTWPQHGVSRCPVSGRCKRDLRPTAGRSDVGHPWRVTTAVTRTATATGYPPDCGQCGVWYNQTGANSAGGAQGLDWVWLPATVKQQERRTRDTQMLRIAL